MKRILVTGGAGYSVLQLVKTARWVTGAEIALEIGPRRPGDPPVLVADPDKASRYLGWNPRHSDLETIVRTAWSWELNRRY